MFADVPKPHKYVPFPVMVKRSLINIGGFIQGEQVRNQTEIILSPSNSKGKVSEILPSMDYKNVHPSVKFMFKEPIKTISLASSLIFFLGN